MELQQAIQEVLRDLPKERLREVLDFARFLAQAKDEQDWRAVAQEQFSRAYGSDEPDYSESDIKPWPQP